MVELIVVSSLGFAAWIGLWRLVYLVMMARHRDDLESKAAARRQLLKSGVKRV